MNFNYADVFNFVYEKLRKAYGWTIEVLSESVYANLLSAFSYGVEQLAFYDEILTKESVFKSAELYSSINYISWMLNYSPYRKQGARSTVYISADPSFNLRTPKTTFLYSGESTYVNKWTPIVGSTINAYAIEDVVIPNGITVNHYNLPVNLNTTIITSENSSSSSTPYQGKITLLNDFGVAIIPISVTEETISSYLNSNLVSTNTINIPLGTIVNIYKSKMFSGEFTVVNIPSQFSNIFTSDRYVAIQTTYYSQTYVFETIQLGTILSVGQVRLSVKEGIPSEYTYIATGALNEKIPLYSPNIDNDEIEVFLISVSNKTINGIDTPIVTVTDEVTILKEDNYLINDLTKYYCTIYNDPNFRYIYFEFGDDIKTKKLSIGQKVLIKYAETSGASANTSSLNVIDSFGTNLVSTRGTVITGLYVTNISGFNNGTDYESVDSIKYNARARFNENNLLISNWIPVINSYPSILKSKVWTESDIDPFTIQSLNQNTVYIGAINKSGDAIIPNSTEANEILYLYLRKYSSPTDVIIFKRINIINVKIVIYYKINPTNIPLFQQSVSQDIKDIYDLFNIDFGTSLYTSNITQIVQNYSSDVIYTRVKLSYLEYSYNNLDLNSGSNQIYLTGTYRNNNVQKDAFIDNTNNTSFSLWIRRKVNNSWQNWIKIGEKRNGVENSLPLTFNNSTLYSDYETGRKISIFPAQIINTDVQVGDIIVQHDTVGTIKRYRRTYTDSDVNDEAEDNTINAFYYVQSYNQSGYPFKYLLIEVGEITTIGLIPDNGDPSFTLTDSDGFSILPTQSTQPKYYYLDKNDNGGLSDNGGKLTEVRGNGTRKFMVKVEFDRVVIVKGFYFTPTSIEAQGLYKNTSGENRYYHYITNFSIDALDKELIPNSNQVVYNPITRTYDSDLSYTTAINRTDSETIVDIFNPEDTDTKGYELKMIYNTTESTSSGGYVYINDVRLPYFNNILDVQTEDIEFIKE